jgi:hypothetical protein
MKNRAFVTTKILEASRSYMGSLATPTVHLQHLDDSTIYFHCNAFLQAITLSNVNYTNPQYPLLSPQDITTAPSIGIQCQDFTFLLSIADAYDVEGKK